MHDKVAITAEYAAVGCDVISFGFKQTTLPTAGQQSHTAVVGVWFVRGYTSKEEDSAFCNKPPCYFINCQGAQCELV